MTTEDLPVLFPLKLLSLESYFFTVIEYFKIF